MDNKQIFNGFNFPTTTAARRHGMDSGSSRTWDADLEGPTADGTIKKTCSQFAYTLELN